MTDNEREEYIGVDSPVIKLTKKTKRRMRDLRNHLEVNSMNAVLIVLLDAYKPILKAKKWMEGDNE